MAQFATGLSNLGHIRQAALYEVMTAGWENAMRAVHLLGTLGLALSLAGCVASEPVARGATASSSRAAPVSQGTAAPSRAPLANALLQSVQMSL